MQLGIKANIECIITQSHANLVSDQNELWYHCGRDLHIPQCRFKGDLKRKSEENTIQGDMFTEPGRTGKGKSFVKDKQPSHYFKMSAVVHAIIGGKK